MNSLKLHITSLSDVNYIKELQERYSYVRKYLYKHFTSIKKDDLESYVMNKFKMNQVEARSIINDISGMFDKNQKDKEKTELRILEIMDLLKDLKSLKKKSKKDKRDEFKLENKLVRLNKSLSEDITFGTKPLLRKISHLNNKINQKFDINLYKKLNGFKTEYQENRINPIYFLGEANQNGNRFFEFDLKNSLIYYKPKRGVKIKIKVTDKRKNELKKLQELIDSKSIPITVRLSKDSISLIYDMSIVSGFIINKKERLKEVNKIKVEHIDKETITTKIKE